MYSLEEIEEEFSDIKSYLSQSSPISSIVFLRLICKVLIEILAELQKRR